VWRSVIKRPLVRGWMTIRSAARSVSRRQCRDGSRPARLPAVAALAGEGQEWMYVAPFFLIMGALQLLVLFY